MILTKMKITARLVAVIFTIMTITSMKAQEVYRIEAEPAAVQLRTNGLYNLALCPNVGIEIQTDLGLAWQLDYIGAWWNNDDKHRYYSNYAFQTEIRYYLASPRMVFPYTGHHFGIYGQMATFDFEFGGKGIMSRDLDFSYGIGLSYGYAFRLNRHWHLDLTAGFGHFMGKYDIYHPSETGYTRIETRKLNFWGPTKLEASFVWNINAKNNR